MPFYVFKCTACELTKEELVKIGTSSIPCEECKSEMKKDFAASSHFAAHGLPNGHNAVRANKGNKE
ncbi:MAG: Zinc ribbon domain [Bacillales bacterium]|jgi:putative FmdB family regulatory protein|nr:Zinc ribbon domain [Bacillales bacterium]